MKQYQDRNRGPVCTISNCGKTHLARGYCSVHYTRWWTKGSPNAYSKNIPNTYRENSSSIEIDLRNTQGEIVGVTIIDPCNKHLLEYRWCMDSNGYALGRVDGKLTRLHKLVINAKCTDHIDRNKLNNLKSNLRSCSFSENSQNLSSYGKTSMYKGVSFAKGKYWAVYAKFPNSKKRFWGYYDSEIEAAKAYNKAAKKYGSEFSYLNTF
jgi:hypothetical protein